MFIIGRLQFMIIFLLLLSIMIYHVITLIIMSCMTQSLVTNQCLYSSVFEAKRFFFLI